jgi:hypothetical protein
VVSDVVDSLGNPMITFKRRGPGQEINVRGFKSLVSAFSCVPTNQQHLEVKAILEGESDVDKKEVWSIE